MRIPAGDLTQLLLPQLRPEGEGRRPKSLTSGLPAAPGAAVGKLAFTADEAVERDARPARRCILVRKETSPEDVDGMHAAAGILTSTGGMTSHAAVVARGWGKLLRRRRRRDRRSTRRPARSPSTARRSAHNDVITHRRHDRRSDGRRRSPRRRPSCRGDFATVMKWADKYRTLKVRTNADTPGRRQAGPRVRRRRHRPLPHRAHVLRDDRIAAMREMILADDEADRAARPSRSCCRSSARTSSASSRR